jgi:heme iron utilization protein
MIDTARELILGHDLCVLATCGEAGPLASLMAYASAPDCRRIYLTTLAGSAKWRNLTFDPRVSLLIDSRERLAEAGRGRVSALTVFGRHTPLDDGGERDRASAMLMAANPGLSEILGDPGGRVVAVAVDKAVLLVGLADAHVIDFSGQAG